jgi:hypothetical protein
MLATLAADPIAGLVDTAYMGRLGEDGGRSKGVEGAGGVWVMYDVRAWVSDGRV